MKAVNLYLLTRNQDPEAVSSLHQALTQSKNHKRISPHEAACLCMLTDLLAGCMKDSDCHSLEQKHLLPPASFHDWISSLPDISGSTGRSIRSSEPFFTCRSIPGIRITAASMSCTPEPHRRETFWCSITPERVFF